jgi:hypothetical protein
MLLFCLFDQVISYYNERVILLLESIGRKEKGLRGDVVACFVALGMENEFVRQLLCSCILQNEDASLQTRSLLLCAEHNLRSTKVVETLSKLAREAENQTVRRIALDCLSFIFLVGTAQVWSKRKEHKKVTLIFFLFRWMSMLVSTLCTVWESVARLRLIALREWPRRRAKEHISLLQSLPANTLSERFVI